MIPRPLLLAALLATLPMTAGADAKVEPLPVDELMVVRALYPDFDTNTRRTKEPKGQDAFVRRVSFDEQQRPGPGDRLVLVELGDAEAEVALTGEGEGMPTTLARVRWKLAAGRDARLAKTKWEKATLHLRGQYVQVMSDEMGIGVEIELAGKGQQATELVLLRRVGDDLLRVLQVPLRVGKETWRLRAAKTATNGVADLELVGDGDKVVETWKWKGKAYQRA